MSAAKSHLLICSCEKTMPLDAQAIGHGCAGTITQANQLCGLELERFKQALADGAPVTVACTQEAPLFREVAEHFPLAELSFVNIRETGGWSTDAAAAGPKAAALIAAAGEDMPPISLVTLQSTGVALVYGRDEIAIEAAQRLADRLDITVLLTKPGDVTPRRSNEFPVLKGTIRNARGHLGAFELAIDDYALPQPSSRAKLVFGPSRDGATSMCDLILDLSGGLPLFPAHELRPGYLRADPRDRAAVERAIADAGNLVGTFDKPRFIHFEASLCAHSRSGITGCTRCLDLCPTGAITPNGNAVVIDANICAGCGSCASVCPTGAASYSLPSADALMRRLRTLLQTYRTAGGSNAVVLFHDGEHGDAIIDALARFGAGLPANALPLRVNEVTQLGPEAIAAVVCLWRQQAPPFDARQRQSTTFRACDGSWRCRTPSSLRSASATASCVSSRPTIRISYAPCSMRLPAGVHRKARELRSRAAQKRSVLETTFRELHLAAPAPVDVVPLAPGAPFGGVQLNVEGCTLCHACVTACPTAALSDNPDRAMLRFTESLCVQCGLCENTCPENVITLEPRLDFAAWDAPLRVLKEEEPFHVSLAARRSAPEARSTRARQTSARNTGCSKAPMRGVSMSSKCARIAASRPSSTRASIRMRRHNAASHVN